MEPGIVTARRHGHREVHRAERSTAWTFAARDHQRNLRRNDSDLTVKKTCLASSSCRWRSRRRQGRGEATIHNDAIEKGKIG